MCIELTKQMLRNVFQFRTLQKLDLSHNSLAEVEDLLEVHCMHYLY